MTVASVSARVKVNDILILSESNGSNIKTSHRSFVFFEFPSTIVCEKTSHVGVTPVVAITLGHLFF